MSKREREPGPAAPGNVAEIAKHCIAKRAGACARIGDCLACSPLEQSLRTASWALARWPHLGKPGSRGPRGRR